MKFLSMQLSVFLILINLAMTGCSSNDYRLFTAGYTRDPGEAGFNIYDFNPASGELTKISGHDAGPNPSYFCYLPEKKLFYVANEVREFKGEPGGGLTTLRYDEKNGQIVKMHEMAVPNGGPCYISLSSDKGFVFMANYSRGSVAVIKLDAEGIPESVADTLFYIKNPPDRSHAHMILSDPAGKKVYVTDLALDKVLVYDFDRTSGKLIPSANPYVQLPEGEGPRHFAFKPDGSKLYVINELGSTVMVFNVDDSNGLQLLQTLPTTSKDFSGKNYCADIHIGKDGKYLYGSNRGENTIVTFAIGADGLLSLAGHTSCGGDWPRNFTIDPSGKFILVGNQRSDNIAVFRINAKTGLPEEPVKEYPLTSPACLKFY